MGIPRKFLWCFKEVSRVFQWSIMWVSKCLKEVQRVFKVFHECFTEVLRVFKEVLRVLQGTLRGHPRDQRVSREF